MKTALLLGSKFVIRSFVLSSLLFVAPVSADFDLAILNPVPKILSVPSSLDPQKIVHFSSVSDLEIELRMVRGNLLPGRWLKVLQKHFAEAPKHFLLSGRVRPEHIQALRDLKRVQIHYLAGQSSLESSKINMLYSIGPVQKIVVLADNFKHDQLEAVFGIKHTFAGIQVNEDGLSADQVNWLGANQVKKKILYLPGSVKASFLYDLAGIRPLTLEISTQNNQLGSDILNVLKDFRGVELRLVLNGKLTIDQMREFTVLDRFSLKIRLEDKMETIPGLAQLLNRISPP